MNEHEFEQFERELQQVKPSPVPVDFLARLQAAKPLPERPLPVRRARPSEAWPWASWFRWLAPATAVVLALAVWRPGTFRISRPTPADLAQDATTSDAVQINRELVSAFDAVSTLPTGEPVRFRCRQWMDEVKVHDPERGVLITQRTPRVEVVPVRFESY